MIYYFFKKRFITMFALIALFVVCLIPLHASAINKNLDDDITNNVDTHNNSKYTIWEPLKINGINYYPLLGNDNPEPDLFSYSNDEGLTFNIIEKPENGYTMYDIAKYANDGTLYFTGKCVNVIRNINEISWNNVFSEESSNDWLDENENQIFLANTDNNYLQNNLSTQMKASEQLENLWILDNPKSSIVGIPQTQLIPTIKNISFSEIWNAYNENNTMFGEKNFNIWTPVANNDFAFAFDTRHNAWVGMSRQEDCSVLVSTSLMSCKQVDQWTKLSINNTNYYPVLGGCNPQPKFFAYSKNGKDFVVINKNSTEYTMSDVTKYANKGILYASDSVNAVRSINNIAWNSIWEVEQSDSFPILATKLQENDENIINKLNDGDKVETLDEGCDPSLMPQINGVGIDDIWNSYKTSPNGFGGSFGNFWTNYTSSNETACIVSCYSYNGWPWKSDYRLSKENNCALIWDCFN